MSAICALAAVLLATGLLLSLSPLPFPFSFFFPLFYACVPVSPPVIKTCTHKSGAAASRLGAAFPWLRVLVGSGVQGHAGGAIIMQRG